MKNEPNPLLDKLPFYRTNTEIGKAIRYSHLEGIDIASLSYGEQMEYLVGNAVPYEPTERGLQIAMTLQSMIRSSYRSRNPIIPGNRKTQNVRLDESDLLSTCKIPVGVTSALYAKGVPGVGKTQAFKRFLATLPQIIEHGDIVEAPWINQRQVVYLYVAMSHDGSRGGLLHSILGEIDSLLGTDFHEAYRKSRVGIDVLACQVIKKMFAVYLGILVIDEIQYKNIEKSGQSEEMKLFLLALINSGIPIVFVGNPGGFKWVTSFTQVNQRLHERLPHIFHPCGVIEGNNDDNWDQVFRGISGHYVLPEPFRDPPEMRKNLLRLSGGIPRIALTIWRGAQVDCLSAKRTCLTVEDLERYINRPEMREQRRQAQAFSQKNGVVLKEFEDLDSDFYCDIWGVKSHRDSNNVNEVDIAIADGLQASKALLSSAKKAQASLAAEKTRQINKSKRRARVKKNLSADDMRKKGVQDMLLSGFDD